MSTFIQTRNSSWAGTVIASRDGIIILGHLLNKPLFAWRRPGLQIAVETTHLKHARKVCSGLSANPCHRWQMIPPSKSLQPSNLLADNPRANKMSMIKLTPWSNSLDTRWFMVLITTAGPRTRPSLPRALSPHQRPESGKNVYITWSDSYVTGYQCSRSAKHKVCSYIMRQLIWLFE